MGRKTNDFVLHIATSNGSGSQSSNNTLVRTLFRMGIPVTGKNLFPSNISGLPTWFTIRANPDGFTARREESDIVIAMNPSTALEDQKSVMSGGHFFLNDEIQFPESLRRQDINFIIIPFKKIVEPITDSGKLKKLLVNMIYVGVLAELLELDPQVLHNVVNTLFADKAEVIELNTKSISAGINWAKENLQINEFPIKARIVPGGNENKILIDGNSASALGWLFGGCTVAAWYPITPSSSLVETFQKYAHKYRTSENGNKRAAIIQAEDELASISMVLGAGWAGARAVTATSGPGLSLMSEAAGLAYFAEIPSVIWNVQRGGPSTGLPTRTQQADLSSAQNLSHGDTQHIVLLPANPSECFEFGQTGFDLAERLQTLVIVLSDLDLGMNLWVSDEFNYPQKPYDRGKVLSQADLDRLGTFARYRDIDRDGIPQRTLPGTHHPLAAYFTRGTGHDEKSNYSENPQVYSAMLDRLKAKFETAKVLVPNPVIERDPKAQVSLIAFGSTDFAVPEVRRLLKERQTPTNYLRLRALPMSEDVEKFLAESKRVYIIEQNRDGQLARLIREQWPQHHHKLYSVLQYDGMPITPLKVFNQIAHSENQL